MSLRRALCVRLDCTIDGAYLENLGFKTKPNFCPYHGEPFIDRCPKCNRPLEERHTSMPAPTFCQHLDCRQRLRYTKEDLPKRASTGGPIWITDRPRLLILQNGISLKSALCINQKFRMAWRDSMWSLPDNLRKVPQLCHCGCPIIGRCPNCKQSWPEDLGLMFPNFCPNCRQQLRYSPEEVLQQLDEPSNALAPRSSTGSDSAESGSNPIVRTERKKLRDEYKAVCKQAGVKVTDEMIARTANPRWHSRHQIQKWLVGHADCDGEPDRLIRKVFVEKPHLKVAQG
jgi:hypothetical protein